MLKEVYTSVTKCHKIDGKVHTEHLLKIQSVDSRIDREHALYETGQGTKHSYRIGLWSCILEVPGSNPPPFHYVDFSSGEPSSIPPRFGNSQLTEWSFSTFLYVDNIVCLFSGHS